MHYSSIVNPKAAYIDSTTSLLQQRGEANYRNNLPRLYTNITNNQSVSNFTSTRLAKLEARKQIYATYTIFKTIYNMCYSIDLNQKINFLHFVDV